MSILADAPFRHMRPARARAFPATQALLLMMVLLWGLSWPATQVALVQVPPLWLACFRFGSAALCLLAFLAIRGRIVLPTRADLPIVLSIGVLQMTAFTGLGMIAMTVTDTSHAVLIAYTTPLWTLLLAWAGLRHRPNRHQLAALVIGLSGIALICSPLETDWQAPGALVGAAFLLTGAICWSAVILHVRRHRWSASPLTLAPWQMLLAATLLGAAALTVEGRPTGIDWSGQLIGMLAFIGPVATSLCFVISAEQGRRISAFAMSNFTLGVPLVGVAASVVLLSNRLSGVFVAGLVLVFCGMVLAARAGRKGA